MPRWATLQRVLPVDWADILQRGQQALQQAEAEAAQRAAALDAAGAAATAAEERPWSGGLTESQARLERLIACADGAAQGVAEVDAALGAEEEALRNWLTASEAARRKLAEWVGRG